MARMTLQAGATAVGDGNPFSVNSRETVGIEVTISDTATVAFEATIGGTAWAAIAASPVGGGAAVTTATASGLYRVDVRGMAQVRARVSAYTGGTVDVVLEA